ncbi:hypothetical protein [Methylobacterium isbiliense]|uniref:hypothetical protein n=1 Tax=Methylobacterium isbiliense TaxID=315478 RepID=UPI001EE197D7|nr:hypothetical protein [Methylobacterium isbiliense]MDN3627640.1 hypothetical protein [Methylobacterium isbiliense]
MAVYLLTVTEHLDHWREQGQRDAQWVSSEAAAELVQKPDLAALIRDLARTTNTADLPIPEP